MQVTTPELKTITVIDYEIILACGKEVVFTLRPDLGDTEGETSDPRGVRLALARAKQEVLIIESQIAVLSRRERQMALPAPKVDMSKVSPWVQTA